MTAGITLVLIALVGGLLGEWLGARFKLQLPLLLAFGGAFLLGCLLYTSPSPRDATLSRMPSSA